VTIRVLMVGKDDKVMAKMATDMGSDFTVSHTQDVEQALADPAAPDVDVVVLGRALSDDNREALRRRFARGGHQPAIVNSLGPLGELVAAQVRGAYAEQRGEPSSVAGVSASALTLDVTGPTAVTVTLFRVAPLFRLTTTELFAGTLDPGQHTVAVPRAFLSRRYLLVSEDGGRARFLTVP
jgi:hypothetical protein